MFDEGGENLVGYKTIKYSTESGLSGLISGSQEAVKTSVGCTIEINPTGFEQVLKDIAPYLMDASAKKSVGEQKYKVTDLSRIKPRIEFAKDDGETVVLVTVEAPVKRKNTPGTADTKLSFRLRNSGMKLSADNFAVKAGKFGMMFDLGDDVVADVAKSIGGSLVSERFEEVFRDWVPDAQMKGLSLTKDEMLRVRLESTAFTSPTEDLLASKPDAKPVAFHTPTEEPKPLSEDTPAWLKSLGWTEELSNKDAIPIQPDSESDYPDTPPPLPFREKDALDDKIPAEDVILEPLFTTERGLTLSAEIHQRFMDKRETVRISELADLYDHGDFLYLEAKLYAEGLGEGEHERLALYEEIRFIVRYRVEVSGGSLMDGYFSDYKDGWDDEREELISLTLMHFSGNVVSATDIGDWFKNAEAKFGAASGKAGFSGFYEELMIDNPWADEADRISFHPKVGNLPEPREEAPEPTTLPNDVSPTPGPEKLDQPGEQVLPKAKPEYEEEPENIANYRQARANFQNAIDELAYADEQLASYLATGKRVPVGVSSPEEEYAKARLAKNRKLFRTAFKEYQQAFKGLPPDILKLTKHHRFPESKSTEGKEWTDFLTEFLSEFDKLLPERKEIIPEPQPKVGVYDNAPGIKPQPTTVTEKSEEKLEPRTNTQDTPVGKWVEQYTRSREDDGQYRKKFMPIYLFEDEEKNKNGYMLFEIVKTNKTNEHRTIRIIYFEDGKVVLKRSLDAMGLDNAQKAITRALDSEYKRGSWKRKSEYSPNGSFLDALERAKIEI